MPLIDPKQIAAFFSCRVVVDHVSVGGSSEVVTSSIAAALTTAGRGGGSVPFRAATLAQSGIDGGALAQRIPIFDNGAPFTTDVETYGGSTVIDRYVYGNLTVSSGVWTLAYVLRTEAGDKPYTMPSGPMQFLPSYSFHMGQLPSTAFSRLPLSGVGARGLRGDDGWAVRTQRITSSGPSLEIDYAEGKHVELTLTGNITSLTVVGWADDGFLSRLTIDVTNTGNFDITWPAAPQWVWSHGSIPILTKGAGASDTFVARTTNAGSLVRADVAGMNYHS